MATDRHAELLLAYTVLPIAHMVREGDIAGAWSTLANMRGNQVREVCMILAAMVDPDQPRHALLGWWEGGRPPGVEHADEWFEPTRPLTAGRVAS